MKFEYYGDINKYSDAVMEVLAEKEIQNNLIISNCIRGREGADTTGWFLGAVRDDNGIVQLVAMMTPPHNLIIYEVGNIPDDRALRLLIREIASLGVAVPGVMGEKGLAARFAGEYSSTAGRVKQAACNMRIYRLDRVCEVSTAPGKLRLADEKDLYFLPYWQLAFSSDCGLHAQDAEAALQRVNRLLADKVLHIWEHGIPVSQAAAGRKTLNGAVVNAVYTPPYYRGKGYATSCVASLSQHLLDSGYKFCSLFTDLANPVSNSIYMKIGYQPVCDYDEFRFGCLHRL